MSGKTKIEWTDATWNWASGCTKISPGCVNCYAERMSKRLRGRCGYPADDPFRLTIHEAKLRQPYQWKVGRRIFVNSMSDSFHRAIPTAILDRAWRVMGETFQHTYLMLTKRIERASNYFRGQVRAGIPPNIWLGATAETQALLSIRGWLLEEAPAAGRFLSLEPLLGRIDLQQHLGGTYNYPIDWVIVGGESGPGARPLELDWLRNIRDQCRETATPLFIKQLGTAWALEHRPGLGDGRTRLASSSKGADMVFWPEDLKIREYPKGWI